MTASSSNDTVRATAVTGLFASKIKSLAEVNKWYTNAQCNLGPANLPDLTALANKTYNYSAPQPINITTNVEGFTTCLGIATKTTGGFRGGSAGKAAVNIIVGTILFTIATSVCVFGYIGVTKFVKSKFVRK